MKLDRQTVAVQDIVRDVVTSTEDFIHEKRHDLTVDMPDEALLVEADRTRLAQVFFNLLHNAAKYTDEGGRLGIRARCAPQGVCVFTQIEAHSTRSKGGIGLTLAERLVSLHGGSISARSQGLGHGAEFEVILPQCVAGGVGTSPAHAARHRRLPVLFSVRPGQRSGLRALSGSGFCGSPGQTSGRRKFAAVSGQALRLIAMPGPEE